MINGGIRFGKPGPFVDNPGEKKDHDSVMVRSRVVLLRGQNVWAESNRLSEDVLGRIISRGFSLLTGQHDAAESARAVFGPLDRIGIKVNTLGGKWISTRPEVPLSLVAWLSESGFRASNILIWDRTNRELEEAGYRLRSARSGVRILGTDAKGAGYGEGLVSHLNVGSLFSVLQTDFITASVSLAILKDHGLAGITAGMKNYFGSIHNPNKYHDSRCDPFVAEVFDSPPVKNKHRLSIIDALTVQYHKGPSYHPQWADRSGILLFSLDPVAADRIGWDLVEKLRRTKGLPSLSEEGREPSYLFTAERMGLGRASLSDIEIQEEEVG